MEEKIATKFFKTEGKLAKKYFTEQLISSNIRKGSELIEDYRSEFSRDRDRILYSTAFRRLSGKTQVFIAGFDAHVRTRLTHTLEVNQISTTLAHALNLNTTLCEAISLGHDIGHTPFGHMGEQILNYIMNNCFILKDFNIKLIENERGFKHNLQSVRILNDLEWSQSSYSGLNLTFFTLWGIMHHTNIKCKPCEIKNSKDLCTIKDQYKKCDKKGTLTNDFYDQYNTDTIKKSWSLEGIIVKWADEIAQRHHDIEDGLIAKILDPSEINDELKSTIPDFKKSYRKNLQEITKEMQRDKNIFLINSHYSKIIVNAYVSKFIKDVKEILKRIIENQQIKKEEDFWNKRNEIFEDEDFKLILNYEDYFEEDKSLKNFLKDRIINSENVQIMNSKGIFILRNLFQGFLTNPLQLPDSEILAIFKNMQNLDTGHDLEKKSIPYSPKTIGEKRKEIKENYMKADDQNFLNILTRTICDYLSYMTDEIAMSQYQKLYESISFRNF